ncbi:MAG: hypothetical protein AB8B93_12485 [Pseudomonadales bacterium]
MSALRCLCFGLIFSVCTLAANPATARAIRFDDGLGACETNLPGGSREVPIVSYDGTAADNSVLCNTFTDPSLSGFSVNYYGNTYDTLFINDNGTLSFGQAFTGSVSESLLDATVPVIAGFFSEGPKRVKIGYAFSAFTIDIDLLDAPGSFNELARAQIVFIDRGDGNFDLELNYGPIAGTGVAQAGFGDGFGNGYSLPGSGVAGAFDGDDQDLAGPLCTPTSLTCNAFYTPGLGDDDPLTLMPALGRYRFSFVDGVPQELPGAQVPAPASLLLLLSGLVVLRRRSVFSRS